VSYLWPGCLGLNLTFSKTVKKKKSTFPKNTEKKIKKQQKTTILQVKLPNNSAHFREEAV